MRSKTIWFFLEQNLIELCSSCPLECNSIEYSIETITSKFPSLSYALELMNNPKIKSNYPIGYNIALEDLRESMVQFSVFYTDFHYTYITQISTSGFSLKFWWLTWTFCWNVIFKLR